MIDDPFRPRVGRYRIKGGADGLYLPDVDGPLATLTLVLDREGSVADVAAWLPGKPEEWWLRVGGHPIIGAMALDMAQADRQPITLHSTPAAWLEAAVAYHRKLEADKFPPSPYEGCAILDWRADIRPCLVGVGTVRCDRPELMRRLESSLRSEEPRLTVANPGGRR